MTITNQIDLQVLFANLKLTLHNKSQGKQDSPRSAPENGCLPRSLESCYDFYY